MVRLTKYHMPKILKSGFTLLLSFACWAAFAQTPTKDIELGFGYIYTYRPVSLQSSVVQRHLNIEQSELAQYRSVIPSGSLVIDLAAYKPLAHSKNYATEWFIIYGASIQLEKKLTYVKRQEILVSETNGEPGVIHRQMDRETLRFFENQNIAKLLLGIAYVQHLDRSWNLTARPSLALGAPLQNDLAVGRELKRELDLITDSGTSTEVIHQHFSTQRIDQAQYLELQGAIKVGVDYKPFASRHIFINGSYTATARGFFGKNIENNQEYGSGFIIAVRSRM